MNQVSVSAFTQLGVASIFNNQLNAAGYLEPSKIQAAAIPLLLQGTDVLGIAQTGTGKTAAFGLPLLQRLQEAKQKAKPRYPRGLVLAPTRELALQIVKELKFFGQPTDLSFAAVYGGVGQGPQVKALRGGIDILVATPGRLLDLIEQKHLSLDEVSMLILDEADRLLDMGFIRDVSKIVAMTRKDRQSLLFSATLPKEVKELAEDILNKPQKIDIAPKQMTVEKIEQKVVMVENSDKRSALVHLLTNTSVTKAIVFARTKHGADKIAKQLRKSDIEADAIHGNKSQNARVRSLQAFESGKCWVLVATDVASRGIDIDAVSHVINYELPHEPESYVHRIGRTGRAGAEGIAWSLVDDTERKRLKAIERLVKQSIPVVDLSFERLAAIVPDKQQDKDSRGNGNSSRKEQQGQSQGQGRRRKGQQARGQGQSRDGNSQSRDGNGQPNQSRNKQRNQRGKPNGQRRNPYQPLVPPDDSVTREQELQAQGNVVKPEGSQRQPKRRRARNNAA
ncbi:MAG: DEAD/DEAH box helicase [Pseudomonadales bacterium]